MSQQIPVAVESNFGGTFFLPSAVPQGGYITFYMPGQTFAISPASGSVTVSIVQSSPASEAGKPVPGLTLTSLPSGQSLQQQLAGAGLKITLNVALPAACEVSITFGPGTLTNPTTAGTYPTGAPSVAATSLFAITSSIGDPASYGANAISPVGATSGIIDQATFFYIFGQQLPQFVNATGPMCAGETWYSLTPGGPVAPCIRMYPSAAVARTPWVVGLVALVALLGLWSM
jgi:hypothetical protein